MFPFTGFRMLWWVAILLPVVSAKGQQATVVKEFAVDNARQAVAVDKQHFYVINNSIITKHRKSDGQQVARWDGASQGIVHLNSGAVIKGKLYCANSNFPGAPMASSIEIFDTRSLRHTGSRSFGIDPHGSLTWVDFYRGAWWCGYAWYSGKNAQEGKDNRYTTVVRYDKNWHKQAAWMLPREILERLGNFSNSGGSWGTDGVLYLTGHDAAELYAVRPPQSGYTLEWSALIPAPGIGGQGIAFDRTGVKRQLYGIQRALKKITVSVVP